MYETAGWIAAGVVIGALLMSLGPRLWPRLGLASRPATGVAAEVLLERIEKVFKVVLAEGYFTEIYSHDTHRSFWGLFRTNKKALIIAKAKVVIGYDFAKLRVERDHLQQRLRIASLPQAEVIAIDTDYEFYDINQGFMNRFDNLEYTEILSEAKRLMQQKALQSDLPAIAEQQVRVMLTQLCAGSGWELELPPAPASLNLTRLAKSPPLADAALAPTSAALGAPAPISPASRQAPDDEDDPSISAHR